LIGAVGDILSEFAIIFAEFAIDDYDEWHKYIGLAWSRQRPIGQIRYGLGLSNQAKLNLVAVLNGDHTNYHRLSI